MNTNGMNTNYRSSGPLSRNTITLNHDVFLRLKKVGIFGESYSDLIGRLLDEKEKERERK
jgi:predicted CopG family antitoxin